MKDVCGNLAETLATADLVVPEVGVVGEGADDLVSPVLVDAVAVVPEWWVSVAFAAAALFELAFMIEDEISQFKILICGGPNVTSLFISRE